MAGGASLRTSQPGQLLKTDVASLGSCGWVVQVLPYTSVAAAIRVCIALVGLCSYPLCIVPLGDSMEAIIPWPTTREARPPPFSLSLSPCRSPSVLSAKYSSISEEAGNLQPVPDTVARARRLAVRITLVALTVICANVVSPFLPPHGLDLPVLQTTNGISFVLSSRSGHLSVVLLPLSVVLCPGPLFWDSRGVDRGVHGHHHLLRPSSPFPPYPLH